MEAKYIPLQLSLDVQEVMSEKDWLVIDGGNTHFWSEIAINIAGAKGGKNLVEFYIQVHLVC